jgi:hypothetical protein
MLTEIFDYDPAMVILIVIDNSTTIIIPMPDGVAGFENIWELLLSREPALIMAAYGSLTAEEKKSVLEHLHRMVTESGWQPAQRLSAQAALEAIPRDLDS